MSSNSFYLLLIPIINILLLYLNILLGPNKNYGEKGSSFECGFHSFLGQNRQQFNISFFLFGLLFLIFDLEIILIYPAKWLGKSFVWVIFSNSVDSLKILILNYNKKLWMDELIIHVW
uniref:NADH-ubiquinone oxidoreductase chain 3 n=1 Tax=Orbilia oligospora TaxID=2813651 RepID=A0A481ZJF3_ORBOL|nr:NADH dehydrogenase subunit 3 [Orbilia oligospora]QBL01991.1 NADH dehydrogenase subunit 3 [Orbilia oligospora]QIJ60001.1 NADH dehydrogenase subunit 3 [Orbilia oligospora]